jgi:hypothetical protein
MNMYHMSITTRTLSGADQLNDLHKQLLPGKKAMAVISNFAQLSILAKPQDMKITEK